ncbi:hypothetical protein NQ314_005672 [Rhamnusium bicolor]|uniref:Cytochrome P450 n=1 Tax=Rhamnusium bicolor TaxID=1586634 RepID=A0AAV8ZF62_9CUCU|nr:hypothetical protein NQ314_005672 [Rhamnusium bicolor]
MQSILLKRRNEITKSQFRSLLDIFIEISKNNADFTNEDIINEAVTFMLAGQDSVGAAVAFSLFFIAKHVDVQKKDYERVG